MKGNCLCGSVEFEIDGNEFNIYHVIALYAKGRVEVPQTRPQLLLDV